MSDAKLRGLERNKPRSAALLNSRRRAGFVTQAQVALAAFLGNCPAREIEPGTGIDWNAGCLSRRLTWDHLDDFYPLKLWVLVFGRLVRAAATDRPRSNNSTQWADRVIVCAAEAVARDQWRYRCRGETEVLRALLSVTQWICCPCESHSGACAPNLFRVGAGGRSWYAYMLLSCVSSAQNAWNVMANGAETVMLRATEELSDELKKRTIQEAVLRGHVGLEAKLWAP